MKAAVRKNRGFGAGISFPMEILWNIYRNTLTSSRKQCKIILLYQFTKRIPAQFCRKALHFWRVCGLSCAFDLFDKLTKQGKAVVHISLSSAISSSYQNACIAASDFDDVYVVDSKSLCAAMGLIVLKACDFKAKGFDARKIASRVNSIVPKVSTTFVLDTLEYLHKGGRCSGVAKFSANVLGIRPSIAVDPKTGTLDVVKKYRGKMENVYKQYADDCLKNVSKIDTSRIVVADSGGISGDVLSYILGLIEGKARFDEIIRADAGCTISSHCGPKTLAIFYIKK